MAAAKATTISALALPAATVVLGTFEVESEVVPETFGVSKKVCETSARPLCVGVRPQGRNHLRRICEREVGTAEGCKTPRPPG